MTDIQQWRRMIQPTRVRTPATAADTEESELATSPATPRKPLRPTFTTDVSQPSTVHPESSDAVFRRVPSWIAEPPAPNPTVDEIVDSIMCNVLADPYSGLTAQFASDLMRLVGGYRSLKDENEEILTRLNEEVRKGRAMAQAWDLERQDYKAEVRRLELILSKGKRGLAEVMLARQDSLLKRQPQREDKDDGGLGTILKVVEKTQRHEDKAWSAQRATMRRRSPSAKMRRISKSLANKKPRTNALLDLSFGTPPVRGPSILYQAANSKSATKKRTPESEPKTSISDDTSSTFSGFGDLLHGEAAYDNSTATAGANSNAKRRSSSFSIGFGIDTQHSSNTKEQSSAVPLHKAPSLKTKASEFLSKFKPQLNIDTAAIGARRFSFEAGDDADAALSAPLDALPPTVRDRLLRKSASMSSLDVTARKSSFREPPLSPVAQSPTTSAPPLDWTQKPPDHDPSLRRPSRIPTPVYRTGTLAKPRRDRDDSSSSLLTAIRRSGDVTCRSNSVSSSTFSSPCGSRIDLTKGLQGAEIVQSSSQRTNGINNRLLEHRNALRGNGFAAAAAKAAANGMHAVDPSVSASDHRLSGRSSNNSRTHMHVETQPEFGKENSRPIK